MSALRYDDPVRIVGAPKLVIALATNERRVYVGMDTIARERFSGTPSGRRDSRGEMRAIGDKRDSCEVRADTCVCVRGCSLLTAANGGSPTASAGSPI